MVIRAEDFDIVVERIGSIGYFHEGNLGIPHRDAFDIGDPELKESLPAHHPYVCPDFSPELSRHLAFRDFLRRSPEYVRRLNELKWELAERYDNDREAYIDGKAEFCEKIKKLAIDESDQQ